MSFSNWLVDYERGLFSLLATDSDDDNGNFRILTGRYCAIFQTIFRILHMTNDGDVIDMIKDTSDGF